MPSRLPRASDLGTVPFVSRLLPRPFWAVAAAVALLAAACAGSSPSADAPPLPPPTPPPPPCHPAPVHERAAALLIVGLPGVTTSDDPQVDEVLDVGVGGVFVHRTNVQSAAQVAALVSDLRARSRRPLVVSTDEESGRVSSFSTVIGRTPSARRLAAERTPDEVRAFARETGTQLAGAGVDLDLAPVADLDDGPSGATIGDRSFSADPATASRHAYAFAAGLADAGVRSAAKHFPGHGRAIGDDHVRRTSVDATLEELTSTDLVPFRDLVAAGVPVVMLSHVEFTALEPGVPASLSPAAYQLLRAMGFQGVAVTDAVEMGAVSLRWDAAEAAVMAVAAGADGVLVTDAGTARSMRDGLLAAVAEGRLSEERLNQAAARMTALAGGDPVAMACQAVDLPELKGSPG